MNANSTLTPQDNSPDSAQSPQPHLLSTEEETSVGRNFLLLMFYQIVLRCGWIFKTESIIIPAVLDLIAGAGWVRGFLPVLGRIGQSIPPLIYAQTLRAAPYKKFSLVATSLAMALSFFGLGAIFLPAIQQNISPSLMVFGFLTFYFIFFCATGLNQLGFGTTQGKLIPATLRGRLMLTSNVIGAVIAISLVALLLPMWLSDDNIAVYWIFGFAAMTFLISTIFVATLSETPDEDRHGRVHVMKFFRQSIQVFHDDRHFRLLCLVAIAFGTSLMLFPHYQALARARLPVDLSRLITWVMIQNAGTAVFSMLGGPLADWRGNRATLRVMMFGVMILPLFSVMIVHSGQHGVILFDWFFILMGVVPITFRAFTNYTLELVPPDKHPQYLATKSLCIAAPVFLSPLVGLVIDWTSFELVFVGITVVLFAGWLMTLFLVEPRHQNQAESD